MTVPGASAAPKPRLARRQEWPNRPDSDISRGIALAAPDAVWNCLANKGNFRVRSSNAAPMFRGLRPMERCHEMTLPSFECRPDVQGIETTV